MWEIAEITHPAGANPVVSRFKTASKAYGIIRVTRNIVEVELIGHFETQTIYVGETPSEGYGSLVSEEVSIDDVKSVLPDYIAVRAEYLTAWGEDWPSKMEADKVEFLDDGPIHAQYQGFKSLGRTRAEALRNLADSLEREGDSTGGER